ncbi:DUF4160 domain-containing protein [Pleomorphovibrio marinus]|uniref:DUF4160 domain-containing protein n=1 Tax=Pleomorphovibrio marinus TaxID=2164132 RepID=UPI00374325A2
MCKTGELLEGEPPRRAQRMIKEGAGLHQDELMKNWDSTQSETPEFRKIQPLQKKKCYDIFNKGNS